MKISQLFTANGLTQAIKAHHAHLHAKYNFPPLSGNKPIHKLAELFEHKSAEPFIAALKSFEARNMSASVNLSNSTLSQIIRVTVDDSKVLVMLNYKQPFVICNINPAHIAPAAVHYEHSKGATVFFGAIAVNLILESDCVIATILENDDGEYFDINNMPFAGQNISLIDEKPMLLGSLISDNNIMAKVTSDDGMIEIDFNAVKYFEQELSKGNIEDITEALSDCNFDADYPTDNVAEYFSRLTTEKLFNYLNIINENSDESIGYRCTVNSAQYFAWLKDKCTNALSRSDEAVSASPKRKEKKSTITDELSSDKFLQEFSNVTDTTEFYFSSDKSGAVDKFGEVQFNVQGLYIFNFFSVKDFVEYHFKNNKDVPHSIQHHCGSRDDDGNEQFFDDLNSPLDIDETFDGNQIFTKPIYVNCKPLTLRLTKYNKTPDISTHCCEQVIINKLRKEVLYDIDNLSSPMEILSRSDFCDTDELSYQQAEIELLKFIKGSSLTTLIEILNFLHSNVFASISACR